MIKLSSKLISSSISLFVAIAFGLLAQPSWAQSSQKPLTLSTKATPQPTEKKVDYSLLIRAMRQFLASDRYLLESKLTLSAKAPGVTMASVARIQTISAEPNQFRTRISFTNRENEQGREYLLVSNGKQVWTYNVEQNVYAVVEYQQFQRAKDNFMTGMLSRLFSTIRNSAGPHNISLLVNVPEAKLIEILETQLADSVSGLTTDTQRLDGKNYTTYFYHDQNKGYQMRAFIDVKTSEIRHFQVANQGNKELDFKIAEQVIHRSIPPSVPANAFRFVPPAGAKLQTTPISINPFL